MLWNSRIRFILANDFRLAIFLLENFQEEVGFLVELALFWGEGAQKSRVWEVKYAPPGFPKSMFGRLASLRRSAKQA